MWIDTKATPQMAQWQLTVHLSDVMAVSVKTASSVEPPLSCSLKSRHCSVYNIYGLAF